MIIIESFIRIEIKKKVRWRFGTDIIRNKFHISRFTESIFVQVKIFLKHFGERSPNQEIWQLYFCLKSPCMTGVLKNRLSDSFVVKFLTPFCSFDHAALISRNQLCNSNPKKKATWLIALLRKFSAHLLCLNPSSMFFEASLQKSFLSNAGRARHKQNY